MQGALCCTVLDVQRSVVLILIYHVYRDMYCRVLAAGHYSDTRLVAHLLFMSYFIYNTYL